MGYTINEDGTVTRDNVNTSSNQEKSGGNKSNGGSDNNNGCVIFIIVFVIVGIIIAAINKNKSTTNNYSDYDTVAVDTVSYDYVVADTVATEDYYEAPVQNTSSLSVSNSNISLGWESQSVTINVYSTSEWWIDVSTESWILLDPHGTQITINVDSNPDEGSRKDYFVIKNNEGLKQRVDIYQE